VKRRVWAGSGAAWHATQRVVLKFCASHPCRERHQRQITPRARKCTDGMQGPQHVRSLTQQGRPRAGLQPNRQEALLRLLIYQREVPERLLLQYQRLQVRERPSELCACCAAPASESCTRSFCAQQQQQLQQLLLLERKQ
jgi:hypothetical protein